MNMKKINLRKMKYLVFFILGLYIFNGCNQEEAPVLYNDPTYAGTEKPVVDSIASKYFPASEQRGWAAIDEITVYGKNFIADTARNFVMFDKTPAKILAASETELKVKAPTMVKDSIKVRVVVETAAEMSDISLFELQEAVGSYYPFPDYQTPTTITFDKNGIMYVSLLVNKVGAGVHRMVFDPNEGEYVLEEWVPKGTETNWSGMKFGYDGHLYGAKGLRGIWRLMEGQTPENAPWAIASSGQINDLDFNSDGYMWCVGDDIYSLPNDGSTSLTKAGLSGVNYRTCRVYDGYLYAAGQKDGVIGIYRYSITGGTLGAAETYFDFAGQVGTGIVYAITFADDGTLFLANDTQDPLITVNPDGSYAPLYGGELVPKAISLAWSPQTTGKYILYTRAQEDDFSPQPLIIRVYTFKDSAPYYGLDL